MLSLKHVVTVAIVVVNPGPYTCIESPGSPPRDHTLVDLHGPFHCDYSFLFLIHAFMVYHMSSPQLVRKL